MEFHLDVSFLQNNFISNQLDLGHGWAPSVVDSATELILIKAIQKEMTDNRSYWIGGSTDLEERESLTFFDYLPTSIGKEIIIF